jgi:hypothetical protein
MQEHIIEQAIMVAILLLYPIWRIFKRAGLNPALSLTVLIPGVGMLITGLILALSTWKLNARSEGDK